MSKHLTKTLVVATVAAAILAIGAHSIGNSKPGSGVGTAAAAQAGPQGAGGGQPPTGRAGGAPPGMGSDVTGATADKVAKAALAKYPGTIERVVKLPDGSYVAHVITGQGEVHVALSASFQVTGTEQRPPGGPPPGAIAQASGTTT